MRKVEVSLAHIVVHNVIYLAIESRLCQLGSNLRRYMKMGLRWWRDVLILSQPKRYLDDR
jgi:hypothetical protein